MSVLIKAAYRKVTERKSREAGTQTQRAGGVCHKTKLGERRRRETRDARWVESVVTQKMKERAKHVVLTPVLCQRGMTRDQKRPITVSTSEFPMSSMLSSPNG